jgi:tetratricopeptide (TPR) repeat protein
VAIATLGLIGLVAGTAAIAWQARVAERERLRAERRFEDVRKLAGWVIYELHDAIANLPGATPARRLLVARALEYLDSLALEVGDDDALQRELADAYRRLAWVQGGGAGANLGDSTDAFESHAKAMAIRGRLAARSPADAQDEVGLALLEYDLGTLQRTVGQVAEAELSFQSAASRLEAVDRPGVMPGSAPGRLGAVYQRLAEAQAMQGKRDAARRSAERAVAEAEEALSAQPDDSALQTVAAASLNQLAAELAFGGELPAALEQLGRARGAIQASPGEPVRDARQVRILLFILNAESRFRARLGDAKGANEVAEDALGTAEDSLGRDPSDRWSQMAVVAAASQLGRCLTDSGDAPGAVPRFRRALAIAERAISEDPDYEVARREAASARYGLGRALLAQGAPSLEPEACDVLRRAEALWSQRQSEGRLPSADAADLERIPGLLELCPIGS